MYKFNGTLLSSFGFIAGRHDGSHVALSGLLDLPARIGKTFHNWGDENSVEPYVLASEIMFGGRDLILEGFIKGVNRIDALSKSDALKAFVDGFTDLVELETKYGAFNVKVGQIQADYISSGFLQVTINMREPIVAVGASAANPTLTPASLQTFGATLLRMHGQRYGRPQTKQEYFTAYENEGYQITKTEASVLEIELLFKGENWTDFIAKVQGFNALLAKEGIRSIDMPNDKMREFFVTEGTNMSRIIVNGDQVFGFMSFRAIDLEYEPEPLDYTFDVDFDTMVLSVDIVDGSSVSFELIDGELIMND